MELQSHQLTWTSCPNSTHNPVWVTQEVLVETYFCIAFVIRPKHEDGKGIKTKDTKEDRTAVEVWSYYLEQAGNRMKLFPLSR